MGVSPSRLILKLLDVLGSGAKSFGPKAPLVRLPGAAGVGVFPEPAAAPCVDVASGERRCKAPAISLFPAATATCELAPVVPEVRTSFVFEESTAQLKPL